MNTTSISIIEGLAPITGRYDGFVIDLWGVLHDGVRVYDHAVELLEQLKATGKPVCLLSNTPRPEAGAIERMAGIGLTPDLYDHMVTSGQATHDALRQPSDDWHRRLGKTAYVMAPEDEGRAFLNGTGKTYTNDPAKADFILAIGIGHVDEVLSDFTPAMDVGLERGLPMVCANPDLIVNAGGTRLAICAGSFAQYYAEKGGDVDYHGKPHAPIYARCRERIGLGETARLLAMGDSMATDVTGAKRAGLDACLITSGIHLKDLNVQTGQTPNGEALEALAANYTVHPDYALALCRW